jgi:hypothetical protein
VPEMFRVQFRCLRLPLLREMGEKLFEDPIEWMLPSGGEKPCAELNGCSGVNRPQVQPVRARIFVNDAYSIPSPDQEHQAGDTSQDENSPLESSVHSRSTMQPRKIHANCNKEQEELTGRSALESPFGTET